MSVGLLYGPYLWLDLATLAISLGLPAGLEVPFWIAEGIIPKTLSPVLNVPSVISIWTNLGTQNLVTSTPSKYA